MKKTLILGGGLTGLSTAWKLSQDSDCNIEVLEVQDKLGGISSTFRYKEYLLDYGPHKIYTLIPGIMSIIKDLIKDDLLIVLKKTQIRLRGKYFDYPVGLKSVLFGMNPLTSLNCGLYSGKTMFSNMINKKEDVTYKDYVTHWFGKGIYQLVFESYARKVWGNPEELSAELARTRISVPNVLTLLTNMITGNKDPQVSADQFYYPKKGMVMLSEALAQKIESKNGKVLKNANAKKIEIADNKVSKLVYEKDGKTFETKIDTLVSTIPIGKLISLITPTPPSEVIEAASALKYRSIIFLYIVANKSRLFEGQGIFFPEEEFIFNRISEQKGFSERMIPKDKTVLTVEITHDEDSELYKASKEDIFKRSIKDLEKAGILKEHEVTDFFIIKMKNAYPVYDLNFKKNMDIVLGYLKLIDNLYTNGRQGLFNYNNLDHCIDMGIVLAEHIMSNGTKDEWELKSKKFEDYRIIE